MDVQTWLKISVQLLMSSNVVTARLDCLILLEDATNKDRGWLLAHPEFTVQGSTLYKLNRWVERRAKHEPLAYIRGKSEFYGREFIVSPDTLQPRPESETMIDLLKKLVQKSQIIDVGTGSGCLAITAKLEFPDIQVHASDISVECLKTAKQNAKKLEADVNFYQGDLLAPIPSSTFRLPHSVLLANLPYVPNSHTINRAAMFEPKIAIFGGQDGLDVYRQLFEQVTRLTLKPKYILTESLPFQHAQLTKIAVSRHYNLLKTTDFIQVFRQTSK